MKNTELYAGLLEREAAISRRMLERVPEGRPDWKPHEKSMPFGYLSSLVASMPSWIAMAINQAELDLNPPGGSAQRPSPPATNRELLDSHEQAVAAARQALGGTNEEFLRTPWRLLVAGKVVQEMPRHTVIEDTFTHLAHHRGQLSVYLRLLEVPLASIYGPTADDKRF